MSFEKINEFDKCKREILNQIQQKQQQRVELSIKERETIKELETSNGNKEVKRSLKQIRAEAKVLTEVVKKLHNDVKQINHIIAVLSYGGENDVVNDVKNKI